MRYKTTKIWSLLLLFTLHIFNLNVWSLLLLNRIGVHLLQFTINIYSEILSLLKEQVFDVGPSSSLSVLYLLSFSQFRLLVFKAEVAN